MKCLKLNDMSLGFTPVGCFPQKLFQLFLSEAFVQAEIKGWHSGPEKYKLQVNNVCLEG